MSILKYRSGHELTIVAALSGIWPYLSPDPIYSAATAIDRFKSKHPVTWEHWCRYLSAKVIAESICGVIMRQDDLYKDMP